MENKEVFLEVREVTKLTKEEDIAEGMNKDISRGDRKKNREERQGR